MMIALSHLVGLLHLRKHLQNIEKWLRLVVGTIPTEMPEKQYSIVTCIGINCRISGVSTNRLPNQIYVATQRTSATAERRYSLLTALIQCSEFHPWTIGTCV